MRHIPFTALEVSSHQVEFVRGFGNKVYYGDPTNMQLLRSAHIEKAKVLVIAVDDQDAAVKIAEEVRSHYPGTIILARARSRQHELKLREIGVHYVIRETLESTLLLGKELSGASRHGRSECQRSDQRVPSARRRGTRPAAGSLQG